MHDDYASFLAFRATQRRLASRFSRPRRLLLHASIFVVVMTAIWGYGSVWNLWYPMNFPLPALFGLVWSLVLAGHAMVNYRRSAIHDEPREIAVEDEMREFIAEHGDDVDQETLFDMHYRLNSDLQQQGRLSQALMAFALVNVVSWGVTVANMGTSWGFQMTLPLAILVIGGVYAFTSWQYQRQSRTKGWFSRLPLGHVVIYGAGVIALWLASAYRMMHYRDAEWLMQAWGLGLLLHILFSVVIQPLLQPPLPSTQNSAPRKRKPPVRLALADDGEVIDLDELDSAQPDDKPFSRSGAG